MIHILGRASALEGTPVRTARTRCVILNVRRMTDPGVTLQLGLVGARENGQERLATKRCAQAIPSVEDLSTVSAILDRRSANALDDSEAMLVRS